MQYIIYKISIQDYVYVGSTKNFTRRKASHKQSCNIKKDLLIYNTINELGGWDCCIMLPIEEFECENNRQAHIREEYHRKGYQANLNSQRCYRTEEEHKEDKKIKQKQHYATNKEEVKMEAKEYYEINKDEINARRRLAYATKKNNTV